MAALLRPIVIILCVSALAACGRSQPAPTTPAPTASAPAPAPTAAMPVTHAPPPVKSQVATFDGNLPCADCAGITTHLVLQRDELGRNSYVLNETYQGKSAQPFMSAGKWTLSVGSSNDPQAALLHMDSGRPSDNRTWRIDNDGGLTLVNAAGKPAQSGLNYSLKRAGGTLDLSELYEQAMTHAASAAVNR